MIANSLRGVNFCGGEAWELRVHAFMARLHIAAVLATWSDESLSVVELYAEVRLSDVTRGGNVCEEGCTVEVGRADTRRVGGSIIEERSVEPLFRFKYLIRSSFRFAISLLFVTPLQMFSNMCFESSNHQIASLG